jgi:hypothetical protein
MKTSSGRLEITADLEPECDLSGRATASCDAGEFCGEALELALFGPEPLDGVETAAVIGSDGVWLAQCA